MYSQIIGTQQIVVTVLFLATMVALLLVLKRKGGVIRATLKAGKRISVIEDTAVSPTERLRLICIDKSEFVMLSVKGQPPVFLPLTSVKTAPKSNTAEPKSLGLVDIDEAPKKSDTSSKGSAHSNTMYPSPDERAAFIEKFQSWRHDHVAG